MTIELKPAEEISTQEEFNEAVGHLMQLAGTLCDVANDYGLVLTISTTPRQPLAMGNYDMLISLSMSHAAYRSEQ